MVAVAGDAAVADAWALETHVGPGMLHGEASIRWERMLLDLRSPKSFFAYRSRRSVAKYLTEGGSRKKS